MFVRSCHRAFGLIFTAYTVPSADGVIVFLLLGHVATAGCFMCSRAAA